MNETALKLVIEVSIFIY